MNLCYNFLKYICNRLQIKIVVYIRGNKMMFLYLSFIDDEKDKSKFEVLYYEYRDRMMAMALFVLHNHEDAEDAVHNTFIAIAKNMKSIDDEKSIRTLSYVLKATKNTSINMLKKRTEHETINIDDIYDISDDEFYEKLNLKQEYNNVVNAIVKLDDKYKDVLFYHFVIGMTANEISKLLGRKQATVKQQLVRGKVLLLKTLGDDSDN